VRRTIALLLLCAGCASSGSRPVVPAQARAPYQPSAPTPHSIEIRLYSSAARAILAALAKPAYDSADAAALLAIPAVRLAIQDANRSADIFDRDLAAAFSEQPSTAVFDFRSIRADRDRWNTLLDSVTAQESELVNKEEQNAAVLLPHDRPVSLQLQVLLSFGLAGLADHILVPGSDGSYFMIVDVARALESSTEPMENQLARLSRLIAGGAFRQAWEVYRQGSPAWQQPDPQLGPVEPLLRAVAESGPVALFSVDENFFPLSVWLKEPMNRTLSDMNRMADILSDPHAELDRRMEMTTAMRRPEFSRRVAGPGGAFLADAIIQAEGLPAFRTALAGGPRTFFQAYDRVSKSSRDLVPLSKTIAERLNGAAEPR
jgi:hypothetical protein